MAPAPLFHGGLEVAPPPWLRQFHTSRLPGLPRTALPRVVRAGGLPSLLVVVDRQHSRACADTQAHHLPLSRSEKEPADEIAQEARSGTAVGPRVAGQTEAVLSSQQLQLGLECEAP